MASRIITKIANKRVRNSQYDRDLFDKSFQGKNLTYRSGIRLPLFTIVSRQRCFSRLTFFDKLCYASPLSIRSIEESMVFV